MRFTRTAEDGTVTTVTGDYDYMGRRIFKKVETTVADPETGESTTSVILNHRYLYRGYLQIAALDLTRTTLNALWYILWDPTEPVATRPLAIQTAGSWFVYGWDLTKNVMELYKSNGTIANSYTYAPFGEVTQRGNITNPSNGAASFTIRNWEWCTTTSDSIIPWTEDGFHAIRLPRREERICINIYKIKVHKSSISWGEKMQSHSLI